MRDGLSDRDELECEFECRDEFSLAGVVDESSDRDLCLLLSFSPPALDVLSVLDLCFRDDEDDKSLSDRDLCLLTSPPRSGLDVWLLPSLDDFSLKGGGAGSRGSAVIETGLFPPVGETE